MGSRLVELGPKPAMQKRTCAQVRLRTKVQDSFHNSSTCLALHERGVNTERDFHLHIHVTCVVRRWTWVFSQETQNSQKTAKRNVSLKTCSFKCSCIKYLETKKTALAVHKLQKSTLHFHPLKHLCLAATVRLYAFCGKRLHQTKTLWSVLSVVFLWLLLRKASVCLSMQLLIWYWSVNDCGWSDRYLPTTRVDVTA